MTTNRWYPAALLVIGCGGAIDDSRSAGSYSGGSMPFNQHASGSTNIDTGVPFDAGGSTSISHNTVATGGEDDASASTQPDGFNTTFDVATGGGPSTTPEGVNTTFDIVTGGGYSLYGPRFDRPMRSSVSTGGNKSTIPIAAEGGALQTTRGG